MRILFITLLFSGCCSTKKVIESDRTILNDSVFKKVELTHSPKITSDFVMHRICDTVRGPVEFEKVFVVEKDTVTVTIKDNSLEVVINKIKDTLSSKETQIANMKTEITRLKEQVKINKVIPLWVWLIGGYLLVVLIRKLDVIFPFLPPPLRQGLRLIT